MKYDENIKQPHTLYLHPTLIRDSTRAGKIVWYNFQVIHGRE